MGVQHLTKDNFDQVINQNDIVVVDFGAEWCAPCRSFEKVIQELSSKHPEIVFGQVDIEKEKELAEEFQIMSIPAVMILRNQVIIYAQTGALPLSTMSELIEQAKTIK